jgi:acyl-coenzyme A synthetase/AMP-(fatty) acid ligase
MLHLIKKHKFTMLFLPPSQIRAITKIATKEDLKSIRFFYTAAAVASDFLLANARKLMPTAKIVNAYGLSETGPIFRKIIGGKWYMVDNVTIKIVDGTGKALGPNEKGVVWVYPQFKFLGYCNSPEKTQATYQDGWINTGDYVMMNDKGQLTIMDRASELIKCGDETVCLTDIEAELEKIETLFECCVVGVPDKERCHILAALVKKDLGSKLTADEIFKISTEKLPPNKHLLGGIFFTDELPKTTSGKILRTTTRNIIAGLISGKA